MSEEKRTRYFIRNQQGQPLELHLSSGVVVLGPREEAEVGPEALNEPQLRVFLKQRLVSTREAIEPDTEAEEPEAAAPAPKGRAKTGKARDQQGGMK